MKVGLCEDDVQELTQRIRIHLWIHAIPLFDPSRNIKLTTFLYRCIENKIKEEIRRLHRLRTRKKTAPPKLMDDDELTKRAAPDISLDQRIRELADYITTYPEKFLTDDQSRAFAAVMNAGHNEKLQDIAMKLGYKRNTSFSMMMRRIKDAITDLDIESWDGTVESIIPNPQSKPLKQKSPQRLEIERRLGLGHRQIDIARDLNINHRKIWHIANALREAAKANNRKVPA